MVEYAQKIPVLIVPEGEMEFGGKRFEEPKILRCEHCGNALFYCVQRMGLVQSRMQWIDTIQVLGETPESKKWRTWSIDGVYEERLCAVCKAPCGLINMEDDDYIAHEFEDLWEVERFEIALDLLQYPDSTTTRKGKLVQYDREIKQIKEWVDELEKRRKRVKEYKEKQDKEEKQVKVKK